VNPVSRPRRLVRLPVAAVAVLSLGLVSACGVGPEVLAPTTAAQVGDDRISVDEVDQATDDLCTMLGQLVEAGNDAAVPGGVARQDMVSALTLRSMADQLSAEYDVEVGESVDAAAEAQEQQLSGAGVDADAIDAVLPQITAGAYFAEVLVAIGREELGLPESEDNAAEALDAGLETAVAWQEENGFEVNPRFGTIELEVGEQGLIRGLSETSVAVSIEAQAGVDGETNVGDLPASQRCGA